MASPQSLQCCTLHIQFSVVLVEDSIKVERGVGVAKERKLSANREAFDDEVPILVCEVVVVVLVMYRDGRPVAENLKRELLLSFDPRES